MSVKLVVALTDSRWYQHLSNLNSERKLEDVNFWQPPAKTGKPLSFKYLKRGELFLFNVKDASGRRKIAGGGIFLSSIDLPCSYAWKILGENNGADSLANMKRSIADKSSSEQNLRADFPVGCRILAEPVFLPPEQWFTPPDWKRGIQSIKGYDTANEQGLRLWELFADACKALQGIEGQFERPQLVRPRLGRGAFRTDIVRVYDKRCAVTQGRTLVALEAAHIHTRSRHGSHEASNGLLMRSDLHDLFDRGYVTVAAEKNSHRFIVSRKIEQDYGNGREYFGLHGTEILLPKEERHRPNPHNLQWHNESVYLG